MKNVQPPRRALNFLRWFCREDYIEEIEGDLTELFQQHYQQGPARARRKFTWHVIRYFRPEFIRSFKINHRLNPLAMFRHNFLITSRSFKRYKSSFLINLAGLSTGLACGLLIFLWVKDEFAVDKFHTKKDRLYEVLTTHPNEEGIDTWRAGQVPLAPALAEEIPEVEYGVSASRTIDKFTLSSGNQHFSASGQFADRNYFTIFSYELTRGDRNNVLADKNSIVVSESLAMKLFGTTENVLGKTVTWQFLEYKEELAVTGVFKDISHASDPFDFAVSFEMFKDILGTSANWGNFQCQVYLLLREGTDAGALQKRIVDFIKTRDENSNVTILLQKYADRYLYGDFKDGKQAGGRIAYVRLFSIIAVFIVIIACINFMNLSTAKASRRVKEIGIKKALGVYRSTLIVQHLEESLLMTILSFLTAFLLAWFFLPQFNIITGKYLSLTWDTDLAMAVVAIIVVTALIAGSYPALYLSGFRPAIVLKGQLQRSLGELFIRRGLVIFQFALSVILIVSVVVVQRQIELLQTRNPGFDRENIIYFKAEGRTADNIETFLTELRRIPGVVYASGMWGSIVGRTGVTQGVFDWEGKDPDAAVAFSHLGVNFDMLELLDIKMKEGRTFSRDFAPEDTKIIINEAGIAVMGLKDPVGKRFNLWGNDMEIIGVAKDFNFRSLHENVRPFFFRLVPPEEAERVMVRIAAGRERETIDGIQAFYKSFNPGFSFDYQFLDEEYQKQYVAEQRIAVLSRYFAGLAILISCLGLFGLAAFTAERRTKEIGIRKVLGSSEFGIVYLLSGDFTRMVLIAIAVALPVSYFLAKNWLDSFAYRTSLETWHFAAAGLSALLVAWLAVAMQTLKAARVNPSECLRNE